jgi:phosphopantothenate-cysteine ligase
MIKNILVTSGGTTEPIDAIRCISNKSTGKLGSLIADEFAQESTIEKIYYIHAKCAAMPQSEQAMHKIIPIQIETVSDLLSAIQTLFEQTTVDAVIHAMAVSDYKIKNITSADMILDAAKESSSVAGMIKEISKTDIRTDEKKISSCVEMPVLFLERTSKILPLFRKMAPNALIIGFKLLSNVPNETLIEIGYNLLVKNQCNFILANDYSTVAIGAHEGFLIDSNRNVLSYVGKENIAKGIVKTVFEIDTNGNSNTVNSRKGNDNL